MNELGLPTSFGPQRQHSRFNHKHRRNHHFPNQIDYEVDEAFNKCFSFFSNERVENHPAFKLPDPTSLFVDDKWKLSHFQDLKTILNNTKSKLNDLPLKEWHLHTTNTNVAGEVMKKLRYTVAPEFLTQAWCKMYECLMTFWLIPNDLKDDAFNTVHLCEAPGAFITALHHYLQTWYPEVQWNWLATTLNPYYEGNPLSHMIQDDRFILHTLSQWTFGADGTGNLMDKNNLHHLKSQVQSRLQGKVMLVTADGSIDCQTNPAEQEALVAPLHYCEVLTALNILETDGSFLLKMFTLLECDSICLLYLLVCVFSHVTVFKPVKSKEGNSEVYVLCTRYIGKDSLVPWLPILHDKFGPTISKAMFSEKDIPEKFKIQVYECAKLFTGLQIQVIERNLDMFFNPTPQKLHHSKSLKRILAERYIEHYALQPIEKSIVGNYTLADTPALNFTQKYEEGTFNDRLQKACQDKSEQVEQLWASLQDLGCRWPFEEPICWFMFNNRKTPPIEMSSGQQILKIRSSKFCNGRILEAFNQTQPVHLSLPIEAEVSTSLTVDASTLPWDSHVSQSNLMLLEQLSVALKDLPPSKSLCIRGLPLLTQISVSVVFLLAHSFFQLGLSKNGNVFLCGYQQALGSVSWIQEVISEMRSLPSNKGVLSLLPISLLCDKSYCRDDGVSFYVCVSCINNTRLLLAIETEVQKRQSVKSIND